MWINKTIENNVVLLAIHGEVDASNCHQLDQFMQEAIEDATTTIEVDAQELSYISSAGLGVFVSYLTELEEKNIPLNIVNLHPKVHATFQILGLDKLMNITTQV